MDASTLMICLSSARIILESPSGPYFMHNGRVMKFGNDGLLYLTIDGGGDRPNAQDMRCLLGKVIR
jgi:glucose/arabinose dehydrogenase